MQLTRNSIETQKGPADWFTGDVYIDAIAAPSGTSIFPGAGAVTAHRGSETGGEPSWDPPPEDVPKTLLGHIERLLGVERSFVERREAVEVVGQEVEMVDAFKQRHEPSFTGPPRVQRA